MYNFMVSFSKLFYVVVFANLLFNLTDAKTIKRYKRRNEDLLNNLNNTFATLMNIMMVDPNDNSQLSKEQFFSPDQLQSADLQDLISNNSIFNNQLSSYENLNNGLASNSPATNRQMNFDPSSFSSNYFNSNQNSKKDFTNNYGNQIIQQQNSYLTQDQLANAPTYLDNNPPLNQIEMNQNDNAITNLIIDDNFNQLNSHNLIETSSSLKNSNPLSKPTTNYLSNYSDLSKYGKIKVSDFQMNSEMPTGSKESLKSKQNLHLYELVNDDSNLGMNEFKKKPQQIPVTSSTVPLKYNFNDDKKNSFRSFSPDFDADFEQFKISNSLSNSPKLDPNQNYFDKTKTRDPIKTTTTFETTHAFNNYNNNNHQNGLTTNTITAPPTSMPPNNNNQVTGEQRITLSPINNGNHNLQTNKFLNNNLGLMVSNNDPQYSIPNEIQPFLVFNQNDKSVFSEIPSQKGYHSAYQPTYEQRYGGMMLHGGHGSYSMPMHYSSGHGSSYSMPMHYSSGHGSYSMPISYSSGHSSGHGGYSMPMHYSSGGHGSSYSIPMHSYSSGKL